MRFLSCAKSLQTKMVAPGFCIWLAATSSVTQKASSNQKRWNVETCHKTLKSHASLAKSPTRTVRTQSNHCFLAIYAACRLTWLSVTHGLNRVALRTRLYLKAVRHAMNSNFKAA